MPVVEHMIGGEKEYLMLISTLIVGTIFCTRKQIQWLNLSDIHVLEASVQDELYKLSTLKIVFQLIFTTY